MSAVARVSTVATALISIFVMLTTTADAITWHNSGSTSFTATTGPVSLSVGANTLTCTSGIGTGTSPTTKVGTTFTVNGTATFSPCNLAGQSVYTQCTVSILTLSTFASGVSRGSSTVTCFARLTATNTPLCIISGTTPGSYTNPSASIPGRLTGTTSSTLMVSHASGTSCLLGTGAGHLAEHTGTMLSVAGSPILNRTP